MGRQRGVADRLDRGYGDDPSPRRVTTAGCHVYGGFEMADLAYAVLLIGGFALLVLLVRGLDSL